jgi:hypothetical protein
MNCITSQVHVSQTSMCKCEKVADSHFGDGANHLVTDDRSYSLPVHNSPEIMGGHTP